LGGIGLMAGPLLGAFYIIGLPHFVPLDNAGLAASSLGWLLLILYFPGGIAQLVAFPRARLIDWLGRRHGIDPRELSVANAELPAASISSHVVALPPPKPSPATADQPDDLVRAVRLVKHYGGVA